MSPVGERGRKSQKDGGTLLKRTQKNNVSFSSKKRAGKEQKMASHYYKDR